MSNGDGKTVTRNPTGLNPTGLVEAVRCQQTEKNASLSVAVFYPQDQFVGGKRTEHFEIKIDESKAKTLVENKGNIASSLFGEHTKLLKGADILHIELEFNGEKRSYRGVVGIEKIKASEILKRWQELRSQYGANVVPELTIEAKPELIKEWGDYVITFPDNFWGFGLQKLKRGDIFIQDRQGLDAYLQKGEDHRIPVLRLR